MTNKNKDTSERRGKCRCSHIDNQPESNVQKSTKSVVRNRDDNFQKISTKILTLKKKKMIMSLTKDLCSLKNAIIKNGKCILHLLNFYLFNAISAIYFSYKKYIETKYVRPCNKNNGKKNKWTQINEKYTRQIIETKNSTDERLENVEKYSDSPKNPSSNAGKDVTATNMPLNCKNIDSHTSGTALEKPMDISTATHNIDKTQFPINVFQDTKSFVHELTNVIKNKSSKSYTEKQHSDSSMNKEITRVFKQKSTSSDKMQSSSSFPKSFASYKYRKSRQTNSFYNGGNKELDNFQLRPRFRKNETDQKKEVSIKFAPTNEMKKFTFDEEKNEKHTGWKNETETQEKRLSFQQYDPAKYKSHHSRIPVRNKESKQYNLKCYEETGTQTDSVFPTDHNVETVSVGTMYPEQQSYTCATHESQDKDMNQELNHITNNMELLKMAFQQISSYRTPSSWTNFDSDEDTTTTPDTNIVHGLWPVDLLENMNTFEKPIRAPPGFPEVPQNSPLTFNNHNSENFNLPSLEDNYNPNSHIERVTAIPPAPPPMQHLYYDYPQFM